MKVCSNCKTEYSDDVEFCLADGTVLTDSKEISETETVTLPADAIPPTVKMEADKNTAPKEKKVAGAPANKKNAKQPEKSSMKFYVISGVVLIGLIVGGYFFYSKWAKAKEYQAKHIQTGELVQAYEKLFAAVKSKDTARIKAVMSKNSLMLAEFAAGQQKQSVEEVLRNGFTATTFADSLPEMRDERFSGEFGALEVWNSKGKHWEDLPFIAEDGEWKFAMGDMFKGSYQKPAPGMAVKEQEAANANNPNLIPGAPPSNVNATMPANSNVNVNTVQVEPIKPVKRQPKKE